MNTKILNDRRLWWSFGIHRSIVKVCNFCFISRILKQHNIIHEETRLKKMNLESLEEKKSDVLSFQLWVILRRISSVSLSSLSFSSKYFHNLLTLSLLVFFCSSDCIQEKCSLFRFPFRASYANVFFSMPLFFFIYPVSTPTAEKMQKSSLWD